MKKIRFLSFAALTTAIFALAAHAKEISPAIDLQKQMNQNLNAINGIFEAGYAPKAWKAQFAHWDLNNVTENLRSKITPQSTVRDYQQILRDFFGSTKDYHVGFSFYSTEIATLPLVVRGSEGKFFLAFIDRTKLPSSSFAFSEGDEIVEFDGRPVADVIREIKAETPSNADATDQALAELTLTRRRAARGFRVPKGPVVLGIQKSGTTVVSHVQLIWDYTPEKLGRIGTTSVQFALDKPGKAPAKPTVPSFLNRHMSTPIFDDQEPDTGDTNKFLIGDKTSYLPELGNVIWRNAKEKYFSAYIYQNADKRLIGVIRIPSYVPTISPALAVAEFAEILKHFKQNTDALVIDQLNNPGGSVFYLYALASMLTDQPLFAPKHKSSILPSDVNEALTTLPSLENVKTDEDAKKALGADLSGYPVSYTVAKYIQGYSNFIVDQWNQGKRMSDAYYLWGADKINPSNEVQYTKPILLLVNELDFSGGDFFPTILQDNKRAKIMGTRTAGAGGYVLRVELPNIFGLESFSYTGSIAERIDLNPIENLGVTPDVNLALTAADFTQNFVPFKNKVNEEVNKFFK